MSTWLYQLNPQSWTPEVFRFEIWEGKHWHWGYGSKRSANVPAIGDTIIFFYAPSGGDDPGIYGWAVLERCDTESKTLYFIPVAPTNSLKMDPWWDNQIQLIADHIRGTMKQATLFPIGFQDAKKIRSGIRRWLSCAE
jgi:hypothetical protein